jgi:glycolate oxidase iron-sulfur subunit
MTLAKSTHHENMHSVIAAADECVMCGLCLPYCPTYSIAKTETESPRGRIAIVRALYEGKLEASDSISTHLDQCLTCMSCERACPANIDYEKIIDAGRAITHKQNKNLQQPLLLFILSHTRIRKFLKILLAVFGSLRLHHVFKRFRLVKLLPSSPPIDLKHITNRTNHAHGPDKETRIAVMNSCAADLVSDQACNSSKLILSKLGCKIIEQKQTYCCGALHQHAGDPITAASLRKKLLHSIELDNVDHVVSLATGCGAQLERYRILENSAIANEFSDKYVDLYELVLKKLDNHEISFRSLAEKVYLHKPCSQQSTLNEPCTVERLLKYIPGIEILHFKDSHVCCGAGGMNTVTHETLADQLIDNKINDIKNSSARFLVSSNIGCALHFQARLKSENIHVQICHPITLLAQQVL